MTVYEPKDITTMHDENYVRTLENVIRQMMKPLRDIPLSLVIEAISNRQIIPFDKADPKDIELLQDLITAAVSAGTEISRVGIESRRANEVGNYIEPFVKTALIHRGLRADTPFSLSGKKKATGYPDLFFIDKNGRPNYLECKTFNVENIDTTQRSFYLSPSEDFKVTEDAHHFILSYEMVQVGTRGGKGVYHSKSYKILTIENLLVDVKYEFNSDNRRMYTSDHILAEGKIE